MSELIFIASMVVCYSVGYLHAKYGSVTEFIIGKLNTKWGAK